MLSCVKCHMSKEIHGRWYRPEMAPNICHTLEHKVGVSKPWGKIIMQL